MFFREHKYSSFHSRILPAQFMATVQSHSVYQTLRELEGHSDPFPSAPRVHKTTSLKMAMQPGLHLTAIQSPDQISET